MRHAAGRVGCTAMLVGFLALGAPAPASAVDAGPNSPGTMASDASFGLAPWLLPDNAKVSDDNVAQSTPAGSPTQYLHASNFAFAIPAGATINGITVAIERRSLAGLISDARVRIVKGGVVGATEHASGGTWPTVDTVATYGGASDLWGETWAASDVNGAGFGVVLSATDNVDLAAVDHIAITVSYSSCGNGTTEPGEDCDDGNTTPGDCCSATCQFEASGSACAADTDACTADECDGAGTCTHPQVCTDQPISGLKAVLKRAPSGSEKAVFVSKDAGFLFPTPNGANDPRTVGAVVELLSGNEGNATFTLPESNWQPNNAGTAFKFVNKFAPSGPSPVKVSVLKQGKVLKVVARDSGLPLDTTVDRLAVRVRTGLVRNCALFESGTVIRDEANKFIAKKAPAPAIPDCSDASLGFGSPSGAFLDGADLR
jgi:cysteine-rich repeat protein